MRSRAASAGLFRLVVALAAAAPAIAQTSDPWAAWRPLEGEWVAAGGGAPGEGRGTLSFAFDLNGTVLVRRNRVDYPAAGSRAASSHEDLIVHSRENGVVRAIYYDNEGHVIRYACRGGDGAWACDSEGPGPLYRLSYELARDALRVSFAIAPSGRVEDLEVYASGTAHRKPAPPR